MDMKILSPKYNHLPSKAPIPLAKTPIQINGIVNLTAKPPYRE